MKENTRHWLILRLTSLPLIPLLFYFVGQIEHLTAKNRVEFTGWIKQPSAAIALLIFIACAFYHACLGMEEIIVDYIPAEKQKSAVMLANKMFFSILGLTSVYAVLAIHFGKI